jgi:hypothetical protein
MPIRDKNLTINLSQNVMRSLDELKVWAREVERNFREKKEALIALGANRRLTEGGVTAIRGNLFVRIVESKSGLQIRWHKNLLTKYFDNEGKEKFHYRYSEKVPTNNGTYTELILTKHAAFWELSEVLEAEFEFQRIRKMQKDLLALKKRVDAMKRRLMLSDEAIVIES